MVPILMLVSGLLLTVGAISLYFVSSHSQFVSIFCTVSAPLFYQICFSNTKCRILPVLVNEWNHFLVGQLLVLFHAFSPLQLQVLLAIAFV